MRGHKRGSERRIFSAEWHLGRLGNAYMTPDGGARLPLRTPDGVPDSVSNLGVPCGPGSMTVFS
ncbi:hypothetical protein GCM10010212_07800 [Paenarthrobacter nicotinovorans]|nr:hypothetical protein GCM10010212_07800 [Paenarthrobacter nicotinovorans]